VEDWEIVLQNTGDNNMTGSRLKQAMKYVRHEHFFATYGDVLADVDLEKLWAAHKSARRLATVTAVRPSSRYGEIDIEHDAVHTFAEKPQVAAGWINGGFMVFAKDAFTNVSDKPDVVLEVDVLPAFARKRQLSAYRHEGFWQSMDTYREMVALNQAWSSGDAPWL
jgi:glucose-1-phosphate cytidylyltransferase